MKLISVSERKPERFKSVLLFCDGSDFTTGCWIGRESWTGYAFNQSPPYYKIERGVVTHWSELPEVEVEK